METENENTLNKRNLKSFKYLLFLAIPIFIELLLHLIVGYSDQLMMSKYDTAVTAITNCNTIINMIITAFTVFSSAAVILITHFKGSKNETNERKVYSASFYFNLIFSILVSLLLFTVGYYFLKLIKCPIESLLEAKKYMLIAGGLLGFHLMTVTFLAYLKANSLMKESMVINLIVNILNIIGNLILIPHFKIVGVAISSSISRFIGLILAIIIYKIKIGYKFKFGEFLNSKAILKKYVGVGLPASSETISYQTSQIIIQLCINGFGIAVVNIKTYASMFAMITYMVTEAISLSMQIVIGELFGKGEFKEAKKKIKQTLILGIICSTVIAVIFFLTAKWDFKIFHISDPKMLKLAQMIMFIDIFLEIGRAVNIVCVRSLQTAGDILFPTILSVVSCWLIATLGSFILGDNKFLGLGLCGVWISMAIDECFRAIIFIIRFTKGKWIKHCYKGASV
ncbi:MAG: MATE family efflux transporter [Anaeroplasmataceae bacterium]